MPSSKEQWPTTRGLVYEVQWFNPDKYDRGHYAVTYSYEVADERYTGKFLDYRPSNDSYLHRDDSIVVKYDPNKPEHSYYPLARVEVHIMPTWAWNVVRVATAILVLLILLFAWRK